jgi:phosphatidate cytidylyltransferase
VRRSFWSNLLFRVLTALVVLPLVLLALFLGPPELILAIAALAVLLGMREFFLLAESRGLVSMRLTGVLLGAAIFAEMARPGWSGVPLWPALALVLFATTLRLARDVPKAVTSVAVTLLGATYLGALGGALAGLRFLDPVAEGAWRLALLLGAIMGADVVGYFVGCFVGRHCLAPTISPNKTIEGAVGALVGGAAGAVLIAWLGLPTLSLLTAGLLGLLAAATGILGDLFESELKRWAGVKDSGTLLPGHGGVLDRLDSLLFGAPVLYYYFFYLR